MQRVAGLLLVFVAYVWSDTASDGDTLNITHVRFKKSETFTSTVSSYVYHMEPDLFKDDGSILFTDTSYLRTTDGKTTSNILYTGTSLYGFKQINSSHVVVVDYSYHCIRMVDRSKSNRQTTLAGRCGSSPSYYGFVDGRVGVGRLRYPWSIEFDVRNPGNLLITDYSNAALRSLNIETGVLSTAIRTGFSGPRGMLWYNGTLLVANTYYISQVKWDANNTVTNTKLVGSSSGGYAEGSFGVSKFSNPHDLISIQDELILVGDYSNRRFRLMDMVNKKVVPVCIGLATPCKVGSIHSYISSLLKVNDDIYVGSSSYIYKLTGFECHDNVTAYIEPYKGSVEVEIDPNDKGVFPPGQYRFMKKSKAGTCPYYINVHTSPIVRTAVFRSEYDIVCTSVQNHISEAFLNSILAHRKDELRKICAKDCRMSSRLQPSYTCDKNVLTVTWPIEKVYPVDVKEVPEDFSGPLKDRLYSSPLRNAEMVILSHKPPLILPRKNAKGETVSIVLSSDCADKNKKYNAGSDKCT